jgi:hypothetical protein
MPGGRPGHKPGTPEYLERKRRQGRETYRRNRARFIARTRAYHMAQAGPGRCDDCGEPAKRRVWVRSRGWVGRLCGDCTRLLRGMGVELVLLHREETARAAS